MVQFYDHNYRGALVTFFADSQAVLKALMSPYSMHQVIVDIRHLLHKLRRYVSIVWVPSHVGSEWHNMVDLQAKDVMDDSPFNFEMGREVDDIIQLIPRMLVRTYCLLKVSKSKSPFY